MIRLILFRQAPIVTEITKRAPKDAQYVDGDLAGNRTRDCAVRGRRLNRLTTRPYLFFRFPLAGNTSRATPARAALGISNRSLARDAPVTAR